METGKAKPLYYKRVIWLKDSQQPPESTQLIYSLLKDNTYSFKQFDIVLDVSELVDLRHTKTVYEYFEQLKYRDEGTKTLCIINHESDSLLSRDILISRVTRMWTSFSTANTSYNDNTAFEDIMDNSLIEGESDSIIDFSESNPFGEA